MSNNFINFLVMTVVLVILIGVGIIYMDYPIINNISDSALLNSEDMVEGDKEAKFLREQIEISNYCETSFDCVNAGAICPIGCSNYVNKDQLESVQSLMRKFSFSCVYDCVSSYPLCKDGRCVSVYE